jgi:hypothetical protein
MCNYGETSSKNLTEFQEVFESEQQGLVVVRETILKMKKKYPNRILMMTKFIKNILKAKLEKGEEEI